MELPIDNILNLIQSHDAIALLDLENLDQLPSDLLPEQILILYNNRMWLYNLNDTNISFWVASYERLFPMDLGNMFFVSIPGILISLIIFTYYQMSLLYS